MCACRTHLLDRVRVILLEDRPYELRDVDGTPVTPQQARAIIAERYTVPDEVRQRNNHPALDLACLVYQKVRREPGPRRTFFNDLRALTRYIYFHDWQQLLWLMYQQLDLAPG